MSVTGPTLPFLRDQVGSTMAEISWIFTARSAGTLGGSFLGGLVLDRFNPYSVFFLAVVAMGLGTGAMPWCKHVWMLMVSSIMVGIANGFLDTGASTVCLQLWGKDSGPYMQAMHFAFAVGGSIAPLLVQAFIGQTALPNNTLVSSSRHVRSVTEAMPADTAEFILRAVSQDPVMNITDNIGNTTDAALIIPNVTDSIVSSSTTAAAAITTTTDKPRTPKPKPVLTDGAKLGDSSKFDAIPIPQIKVPEVPAATTPGNLTTSTTTSLPTVGAESTPDNVTRPNSTVELPPQQNATGATVTTSNQTSPDPGGNVTAIANTTIAPNDSTVTSTSTPLPVASSTVTEVTASPALITTIVSSTTKAPEGRERF